MVCFNIIEMAEFLLKVNYLNVQKLKTKGNFNGTGSFFENKTGSKFIGSYRNGQKHGHGIYISSDGTKYEGFKF